MSESVKRTDSNPGGYSPKDKPEILRMAEGQHRTQNKTENKISGIPYMGYGNPSAVCFIGSVMRLMESLGDPVEADELFSLSGTALCFPWKAGLCCDEVSILPDIPRRTLAAFGYESEYIYEPNIRITSHMPDDTEELIDGQPKMMIEPRKYPKEFYIEKIRSSIDQGRPVLGFGLTELNYSCLVTGYYKSGDGLYLRAYWSPKGTPSGYAQEQYFTTEDWFEKCCGLLVPGDKTGERPTGKEAYRHVRETAKIFRDKKEETTLGSVFYNGSAAFDDMRKWLTDDAWWNEGCDMNYREMLFKPCGLLLFGYYRNHLYSYLARLEEQNPGLVHPGILPALERLAQGMPGADRSRLQLDRCVDPALTDFAMLRDRAVRIKVAGYVKRLQETDDEIFKYFME